MRLTPALLALGVLLVLVPPAAAADLPIVAMSIAFHGGEIYERSEISFTISSLSGSYDVVARHDGGLYRHAVTTETDEGTRTVVVTNDAVEVFVDGVGQPVPAESEPGWRNHVSARVWFPLLPFRLSDPGVVQHDLGLETWPATEPGGEPVRLHRVGVTFETDESAPSQDEYLFWFDPETGRLERLAYRFDGGLRFREPVRFRRVGGILFSDHENYGLDWDDERDALPIDVLDPAFVAERLEHVSTIRLEEIRVEPVARPAHPGGSSEGP